MKVHVNTKFREASLILILSICDKNYYLADFNNNNKK